MAQFKAEEAVEALEYDLRPFVDKHGIIPEPSTQQLEAYFNAAREVAKEVMAIKTQVEKIKGAGADGDLNVEELSDEEIQQITTDLESVDIVDMQDKMTRLITDLCSNEPSFEDVVQLPFRVRQAFIKWVGNQFRS